MIFFNRYRFEMKIIPTLLLLIGLVIFLSLAKWQIHRYGEKQNMLEEYKALAYTDLTVVGDLKQFKPRNYMPVILHGRYLVNDTILLQNKMREGRVGYEVITPFQLSGTQENILINRGWVAQAEISKVQISLVSNIAAVSGRIYFLRKAPFILGANILDTHTKPYKLQRIDIPELEHLTHLSLAPYMIRLIDSQPGGFVRDWPVVNMTPEKHLGYALQWFLFALIALGIYLYQNISKIR